MHFAQMAAGTALIGGQKRVDLVQAYLLMATYPVPSRRWDEDRGWIYLGLAIRYVRPSSTQQSMYDTGLTMAEQDGDGPKLAPAKHSDAGERDARSRDAEPGSNVAALLQSRPLDGVRVREGADDTE